MNNQRKQLLSQLAKTLPSQVERQMAELTIERICCDMADFYERFYAFEGPGVIVYVPEAEKQEDTMFYMTVPHLIAALKDFEKQESEGPKNVMQKAIARAEALDPDKEALFIIQDSKQLGLFHINKENPLGKLQLVST